MKKKNRDSTPCKGALSDYAFLKSPRCGAKTRQGTLCNSPAVKNKKRCRMHGGAKRSGAPKGNLNALRHGYYSNEVALIRKMIKNILSSTFCE